MQAGKYDRLIKLYRMVRSRSATGSPIDTPTQYGTAWARRVPLKGTERWVANQVAAQVDERLNIRWRPNLSPVCEIEMEGIRYDVTAVTEVGRRDEYEILATARAEKTATPT